MEEMTVRYCFDVQISARHDPRDIGTDILERINTIQSEGSPLPFTVTDARYTVTSGRQISETGLPAPRRGEI